MFKNSFKKICAVASAVAIAAQLFVMPAAHAVSIDAGTDRINEELMKDKATLTATTYNNTGTTASTSFDLGPSVDKTKDFAVQFDLTLDTKQAKDSGYGDGGRGRTAFYVEVQGSDAAKHAGGVFHINTVTDTAAAFHWKWTSTQGLTGANLEYGKKYTVNMLVTTANTITLTIYNDEGAQISKTEGLSMRAATCANAARLAVGLNSQENGEAASVTFENVISYNPLPDNVSVTLGGTTLKTDEALVIELPNREPYSSPIVTATTLAGKALAGYNFNTSIVMMDGSETPFAIGITEGSITADLDLVGGTEDEPAVYETKLIVTSKEIEGFRAEFPITFTKVALTPDVMVEEYVVIPKNDEGTEIADKATISDNLLLDKGNSKVSVEWMSSNEEVISSETGAVKPLVIDTVVTLTAVVTSKEDSSVSKEVEYTYTVKGVQNLINEYAPSVREKDATADITSGNVAKDLVLDAGNSVINIEWESDDENVISSETGIVVPDEDDTSVTLTATVTSADYETYFQEDIDDMDDDDPDKATILKKIADGTAVLGKVVSYTYNVKGVKTDVDAAIAALKFVSADSEEIMDFSTAINSDFILPSVSSENSAIKFTWKSDKSSLSIVKNVAEILQKTLDPEKATLIGTVQYVKDGIVCYEDEIEYNVEIDVTQEGTADKYIVRCDAAATKNFKDCPEDGDTIDSAKDICDGDGLPTKGIFGSKIEWSSSVPSAISNTGKTVKRQSVRKLVTLTATISKGNADAATYKIEDLIVPSSSGSTSGGSGGGSGSSNSNTAVSSTGNKASNVSYKGTLVPTTSLQKGDITTATVVSFSDLGDAAWAKDAVTFLANKAIINGKTASSFAPNDDITRAEFAKIVVKAFGLEDVNATVSNFSDVSASDWYYTAVASAYNKGIIKGYEDGTFGVNDKITRQDMAVIIYRAAQVAGKTIAPVKDAVVFDDAADIASYATEAVAALQKGGVINGMTATTFAPTATATRAQAAQMIYGLVK